jgi:hypothetical protein
MQKLVEIDQTLFEEFESLLKQKGRTFDCVIVGANLTIRTLGRADLLKTKLFAYCDRQQDLKDCLAMRPSEKELKDCLEWLKARDGNPLWPEHVARSLSIILEMLT